MRVRASTWRILKYNWHLSPLCKTVSSHAWVGYGCYVRQSAPRVTHPLTQITGVVVPNNFSAVCAYVYTLSFLLNFIVLTLFLPIYLSVSLHKTYMRTHVGSCINSSLISKIEIGCEPMPVQKLKSGPGRVLASWTFFWHGPNLENLNGPRDVRNAVANNCLT